MRLLIAVALLVLVGGWLLVHREGGGGGGDASADLVLSCLQGEGRQVRIVTSSTGERQVEVTHGPARISPNMTLESSDTDIAFLPSENEAAWWQGQLQQAPVYAAGSVEHRGRVLVIYGQTATSEERTAIA